MLFDLYFLQFCYETYVEKYQRYHDFFIYVSNNIPIAFYVMNVTQQRAVLYNFLNNP